jgi:hypothetical protein
MSTIEKPPDTFFDSLPSHSEVKESKNGEGESEVDVEDAVPAVNMRALAAVALSTTAAAAMAGGIFGSWTARAYGELGVVLGVGWTYLVLRRRTGRLVLQLLLLPTAVAIGALTAIPGSSGRSPGELLGAAVRSGRVLRPPIPFDAGWRPLLILVFAIVGFSGAWLATELKRPKAALALPLGIVALTAITQAPQGQLAGSLAAGLPFLAAVAVLFAGDSSVQLTGQFERTRLLRSAALAIPAVLALVLLSNSDILFPKPAYNPSEKPQKPRSVPLSAARDRVLFEVDGPITGPWVIGALDVYDGTTWRLAPYNPKRLKRLPADGIVNPAASASVTVKFTTRDLGDTTTFPGVALPAKASFPGQSPLYDNRTDTFRVKSGRLPANYSYSISLPAYPKSADLEKASPRIPSAMREFLRVPKAPPAVQDLLRQAPANPWLRLDALRTELNKVVVASGAGVPGPVRAAKVQDLLAGQHEGTPFEIVAAEAMLARWAGVPSRIGFGFDLGQTENNVVTIRPKNAAQFLEVWFDGYGWVPVIGAPPKAKIELNNKNAKVDPTVIASDDVAVDVYVPVELQSFRQLYQRVRSVGLRVLPFAGALLLLYLGLPWVQRTRRSARRRRWAAAVGPRAIIGVEYAEFRDLATDLGVGDPLDTPLEYLVRLADDDEHTQFAWLVARALYGDLEHTAGQTEVDAARELGESLRRRMFRAQALQTRVLAVLSRASLIDPYSREAPNIELLKLRRHSPRTAGPVARRLALVGRK